MKARSTADERARECGCPDWVEPCVHFDGQILILTRGSDAPPHNPPECELRKYCPSEYHVNLGTHYGPCSQCGVESRILGVTDFWCADTLDAARDEFRRREAVLLGREA